MFNTTIKEEIEKEYNTYIMYIQYMYSMYIISRQCTAALAVSAPAAAPQSPAHVFHLQHFHNRGMCKGAPYQSNLTTMHCSPSGLCPSSSAAVLNVLNTYSMFSISTKEGNERPLYTKHLNSVLQPCRRVQPTLQRLYMYIYTYICSHIYI